MPFNFRDLKKKKGSPPPPRRSKREEEEDEFPPNPFRKKTRSEILAGEEGETPESIPAEETPTEEVAEIPEEEMEGEEEGLEGEDEAALAEALEGIIEGEGPDEPMDDEDAESEEDLPSRKKRRRRMMAKKDGDRNSMSFRRFL